MRPVVAAAFAAVALAGSQARPDDARTLFEFRVGFWNGLHHELHAQSRPRPAAGAWAGNLPEDVRQAWTRAVERYRPLGRRSLLFDEGLASLSAILSTVPDDAPLPASRIDAGTRALLEAAAPAFRTGGWPVLQRDAQALIAQLTPLVAAHRAAIAPALAAAYGATWERTVPVDVVLDAGPPGNAHTTVRPYARVTIAASDARHQGLAGLEILFHEASHEWDATLSDLLLREARAQGRVVRGDLWHGVLFFTAGELTRRGLARSGIAYEPYAVTQGMTTGVYAGVWPAIVTAWTPYLDRRTTLAEAATALVRAVGTLPPAPPR